MAHDARNHPIAVARALELIQRSDTAQLQAAIRRNDGGLSALDFDSPQKGFHTAINDLLHLAQPTVGRIALQAHPHAIAVHHAAHLPGRQKHTVLEPLHADEAVALRDAR